MLTGAGERLRKDLDRAQLLDFSIPYVANLTADYVRSTENIRELLEKQISSPVRWQQSVERLLADGFDTFVEIGPGRTLSSFVKKIKAQHTEGGEITVGNRRGQRDWKIDCFNPCRKRIFCGGKL